MKSECRRVAMARPKSRLAEIPASQTQIHSWPTVLTRSCNEQPRRRFNVSRFLSTFRRFNLVDHSMERRREPLAFLLVKACERGHVRGRTRGGIPENFLGIVQGLRFPTFSSRESQAICGKSWKFILQISFAQNSQAYGT